MADLTDFTHDDDVDTPPGYSGDGLGHVAAPVLSTTATAPRRGRPSYAAPAAPPVFDGPISADLIKRGYPFVGALEVRDASGDWMLIARLRTPTTLPELRKSRGLEDGRYRLIVTTEGDEEDLEVPFVLGTPPSPSAVATSALDERQVNDLRRQLDTAYDDLERERSARTRDRERMMADLDAARASCDRLATDLANERTTRASDVDRIRQGVADRVAGLEQQLHAAQVLVATLTASKEAAATVHAMELRMAEAGETDAPDAFSRLIEAAPHLAPLIAPIAAAIAQRGAAPPRAPNPPQQNAPRALPAVAPTTVAQGEATPTAAHATPTTREAAHVPSADAMTADADDVQQPVGAHAAPDGAYTETVPVSQADADVLKAWLVSEMTGVLPAALASDEGAARAARWLAENALPAFDRAGVPLDTFDNVTTVYAPIVRAVIDMATTQSVPAARVATLIGPLVARLPDAAKNALRSPVGMAGAMLENVLGLALTAPQKRLLRAVLTALRK